MPFLWINPFGSGASNRRQRRADRIAALPDRRLLVETYLPSVAASGGRILWVGTQIYTVSYFDILESQGGMAWSVDIDPAAAQWGHPIRHRTGDVRHLAVLFPDLIFDAVICNGVLGYGIDSADQQIAALASMASVLQPDGLLILGWNTDRIADPVKAGLTSKHFTPTPFAGQPARVSWSDVTHVYDSLRRRP